MKSLVLGLAAAGLVAGSALAQTSSSTPGASPDAKGAASSDSNQAVVTTSAHADAPAKGANSFTQDEAGGRIGDQGYTDVTGLKKDPDGIWRGQAKKGGQQVAVWLDYKGNVGQGQ